MGSFSSALVLNGIFPPGELATKGSNRFFESLLPDWNVDAMEVQRQGFPAPAEVKQAHQSQVIEILLTQMRTFARVRARIGRSAALAIAAGSAPRAAATTARSDASVKAGAFSITIATASALVIAPCDMRRLRRVITSPAATHIWV